MNTTEVYDLLVRVQSMESRREEHYAAIDGKLGQLMTSIARLDVMLRGNGSPGLSARVAQLEDQCDECGGGQRVTAIEARLSERAKATADRGPISAARWTVWGMVAAAVISAASAVYAAREARAAVTAETHARP